MRTTETLDKLYLEWSQFTQARTSCEIGLEHSVRELLKAIEPFHDLVISTNGRIPTEKLSLADWHKLITTYAGEKAYIDGLAES